MLSKSHIGRIRAAKSQVRDKNSNYSMVQKKTYYLTVELKQRNKERTQNVKLYWHADNTSKKKKNDLFFLCDFI